MNGKDVIDEISGHVSHEFQFAPDAGVGRDPVRWHLNREEQIAVIVVHRTLQHTAKAAIGREAVVGVSG